MKPVWSETWSSVITSLRRCSQTDRIQVREKGFSYHRQWFVACVCLCVSGPFNFFLFTFFFSGTFITFYYKLLSVENDLESSLLSRSDRIRRSVIYTIASHLIWFDGSWFLFWLPCCFLLAQKSCFCSTHWILSQEKFLLVKFDLSHEISADRTPNELF